MLVVAGCCSNEPWTTLKTSAVTPEGAAEQLLKPPLLCAGNTCTASEGMRWGWYLGTLPLLGKPAGSGG